MQYIGQNSLGDMLKFCHIFFYTWDRKFRGYLPELYNRSWISRIFPKFTQLWGPVSPSSRGVRSSDYVRSRALDVIFQENKKVLKNIF